MMELDARLLSVAELVRQGAYFSDIGTDHAYLPIFLLERKIIERAVLSDVNEGPLLSARENARAAGLTDKMEFYLSNGAKSIPKELPITDYAICGMGGELILEIIEASFERFSKPEVHLILQPMTKEDVLRKRLASLGFEIRKEKYSEAQGRFYVAFLAEHTGRVKNISDFEAYFGENPESDLSREKLGYIRKTVKKLRSAATGKALGGIDSPEEKLLFEIEKRILDL